MVSPMSEAIPWEMSHARVNDLCGPLWELDEIEEV